MESLVVRAYNVGFGDAVLVRIPERQGNAKEIIRHVLIDVGSVQSDGEVLERVVADIERRLDGRPLDLYVMTHEHLDHVRGLYHAFCRTGRRLAVEYAWLTASAAPSYYRHHPAARKKLNDLRRSYLRIAKFVAAGGERGSPKMLAMLDNNNPALTGACVDYIRRLARRPPAYVHREFDIRAGDHHPFTEARFTILAPEEDASLYYGRFPGFRTPLRGRVPGGVNPSGFRRLARRWSGAAGTSLLEIDKAANNTSIVFQIEWRGWKLLFAGDAELRSWKTMVAKGALGPVHFLKVAHHGSENGTPAMAILRRVLPLARPGERSRHALISTSPGAYQGVPADHVIHRIRQRCAEVRSTTEVQRGRAIELRFDDDRG